MSVLYRAMWSGGAASSMTESVKTLDSSVTPWVRGEERSEQVPREKDSTEAKAEHALVEEGRTELNLSDGRHRVINCRRPSPEALEIITSDLRPGDQTKWTTTIRVVAHENRVYVLVENSMESDDLISRFSVGRPRVVHDLLHCTRKPVLGSNAVLSEPLAIQANAVGVLIEQLANPDRLLPMIVCSQPGGHIDTNWQKTARRIANRTEGVATVFTLDSAAVTAFRRQLGDLAIWGGGIRIYSPEVVTRESEGWHHRYYAGPRLVSSPSPTIDRIVSSVARLSARRRVLSTFDALNTHGALGTPADDQPMIPLADLESEREQWEFDLELAVEQQGETEKQLSRANGHLARLKEALIAQGLADLVWSTKYETEASVPDEVTDTSEAVLAAQAYLSDWLAVPEAAVRDLEDIDTAPTAYVWGNSCWRGLRALAAYAQDCSRGWDGGGFWEWCAQGNLLAWPATTKKLAIKESETVQNNDRLREARRFHVDSAVDPSERIIMFAHLKIAEGGGNLAPRVYFYDDTRGKTKKVHVGFIGPHYLVPNKSTN